MKLIHTSQNPPHYTAHSLKHIIQSHNKHQIQQCMREININSPILCHSEFGKRYRFGLSVLEWIIEWDHEDMQCDVTHWHQKRLELLQWIREACGIGFQHGNVHFTSVHEVLWRTIAQVTSAGAENAAVDSPRLQSPAVHDIWSHASFASPTGHSAMWNVDETSFLHGGSSTGNVPRSQQASIPLYASSRIEQAKELLHELLKFPCAHHVLINYSRDMLQLPLLYSLMQQPSAERPVFFTLLLDHMWHEPTLLKCAKVVQSFASVGHNCIQSPLSATTLTASAFAITRRKRMHKITQRTCFIHASSLLSHLIGFHKRLTECPVFYDVEVQLPEIGAPLRSKAMQKTGTYAVRKSGGTSSSQRRVQQQQSLTDENALPLQHPPFITFREHHLSSGDASLPAQHSPTTRLFNGNTTRYLIELEPKNEQITKFMMFCLGCETTNANLRHICCISPHSFSFCTYNLNLGEVISIIFHQCDEMHDSLTNPDKLVANLQVIDSSDENDWVLPLHFNVNLSDFEE